MKLSTYLFCYRLGRAYGWPWYRALRWAIWNYNASITDGRRIDPWFGRPLK